MLRGLSSAFLYILYLFYITPFFSLTVNVKYGIIQILKMVKQFI